MKFFNHRKESYCSKFDFAFLLFPLSLFAFFFFWSVKMSESSFLKKSDRHIGFFFSLIFNWITFIWFRYFWAEILKKAFSPIYIYAYYEFDIKWHVTLLRECQNSNTQTQKFPLLNHDCLIFLDKNESKKQILHLRYEINMTYLTFAKQIWYEETKI